MDIIENLLGALIEITEGTQECENSDILRVNHNLCIDLINFDSLITEKMN